MNFIRQLLKKKDKKDKEGKLSCASSTLSASRSYLCEAPPKKKKLSKLEKKTLKELVAYKDAILNGSLQKGLEFDKNKDYKSAYLAYMTSSSELEMVISTSKFSTFDEELEEMKFFTLRLKRNMAFIKQLAKESLEKIVLQQTASKDSCANRFQVKTLPEILTLTDQIIYGVLIPEFSMEEGLTEDNKEDSPASSPKFKGRLDHSDDDSYMRELDEFEAAQATRTSSSATNPCYMVKAPPKMHFWLKDSEKMKSFLDQEHTWDSVKYLLHKTQNKVSFTDIQGYNSIKRKLYQGIIYPLKHPQTRRTINCQNLSRRCNVLIHGPSGTGKTQFANAIATELHDISFFIHIKPSDILGKYVGESEKNVRHIFEMSEDLSHVGKVILFFDEGETVFAAREGGNKNMASVTSELLSFMSQLPQVMIIVSTNLPWTFEEAFRRRFSEKILLDLPTTDDLAALLKFQLREYFIIISDADYKFLASKMVNYAAGDVALFCDIVRGKMNEDINDAEYFRPCPYRMDGTMVPCSSVDSNARRIDLDEHHLHIIDHHGFRMNDLLKILNTIQKATSQEQVEHHRAFSKDNNYNPARFQERQREEQRFSAMSSSKPPMR